MVRAEPDRAALEIAHHLLHPTAALDDMLKVPALTVVLKIVARQHMKRCEQRDVKRLQANDYDD
jgi:hypothetical protein